MPDRVGAKAKRERPATTRAGGTIYRATAKQGQGWRDGNACTTSELRGFLRGAYTGGESLLSARIGRIGVFCEPTGQAGQAPQPGGEGRAVRIKRTGVN